MKVLLKKTIGLKNLPKTMKGMKHKIDKFAFFSPKDIAIIKQSEREFANGEELQADDVFRKLREEYGY